MNRFQHVVSIAAVAALAGCGSSSGGGAGAPYVDIGYTGPTTTVPLDSTARIAMVATDASGGVSVFSSASDTSAVAARGAAPAVTVKSALAALSRHRIGGGAVVAGVTQSDTQPCYVSGSVTAVASFADPTGATLTAGDSFSVTFNACDDGYGVSSGSMSVTINACPDGAYFLDPTAITPGKFYAMSLTVRDFATVDTLGYYSGIEGDMTVSLDFVTDLDGVGGWLTSSVAGGSIAFEEGYDKVASYSAKIAGIAGGTYLMESGEHYPTSLYDWPDEYGSNISARLCSSEMGGCINVRTTAPIYQLDGYQYPYTGTVKYSDDSGHYVELSPTSGSGAVTLYYDVGAGRVGPVYTTWSCLAGATPSACFP
jgi:hypothetical protein